MDCERSFTASLRRRFGEARWRCVKALCGPTDGKPSERIADDPHEPRGAHARVAEAAAR
jgi:hypothetical protein